MPEHVAIIMDGNGRWAQQRGLPRSEGHRRGVESVRRTVRAAGEMGIRCLTIFSFSSENWSRPASEVIDLMSLLKRFIRRDLVELHRNNVRVRVIGDRSNIEGELIRLIAEAEDLTAANTGLELTVAFNYGARGELVRATRKIAAEVAAGRLRADDIDETHFNQSLDTHGLPDLDLLIRTSGEMRLSNFLLWQAAYAELVFLDIYWPDFDRQHLEEAVTAYQIRDRRFGGLAARSSA